MASMSKLPLGTTTPPRKRHVTYGKQDRNRHNQDFESAAFDPPSHYKSPAKLPSVAPSPSTGRLNGSSGVASRENDDFDVPSSSEETPGRSSNVKNLDRKPKSGQQKTSKDKSSLSVGKIEAVRSKGGVVRAKRKHKVAEHKELRGDPGPSANLWQIETEETSHKKRKATNSGQAERITSIPVLPPKSTKSPRQPRRKQNIAGKVTRPVSKEPVHLDKMISPDHPGGESAILDTVWDIPASYSESEAKKTKSTPTKRITRISPKKRLHSPFETSAPVKITSRGPSDPSLESAAAHVTRTYSNENATGPESQTTTKLEITTLDHPMEGDSYPITPPTASRHSTPVSQRRGITTPTQAKLWNRLLHINSIESTHPDPTNRSSQRRVRTPSQPAQSTKEKRKKKRLIDTLMTSALPSSEEALESDESSQSDASVLGHEGNIDCEDSRVHRNAASSSQHHAVEDSSPRAHTQLRHAKAGPKFTYGGERSHLADSQDSLESLLSQPLDIGISAEDPTPRIDRASSRWRDAVNHATNREEDEDGTKAVRTIHDLRAGGDAERFADEVNDIIDDLDSAKSTLSRKRSAVLELCQKLLDPDFRTRFVDSSYESRFMQLCSSESDLIIGGAVSAAIYIIMGSEGSWCNPHNLYNPNILSTLSDMLDWDRDLKMVAKDRVTNMSRVAQSTVKQFCERIASGSSWIRSDLHSVSPMSLALRAIELMVRKLREHGNRDTLLNRRTLNRLLNIFEKTFLRLESQDPNGLGAGMLEQLETILSILESCTTVSACAFDKSLWDEHSVKQLSNHLNSSMALIFPLKADEKNEEIGELRTSMQKLIPRLLLNISNNNERIAKHFARESFIRLLMSRILTEFDLQETGAKDDHKDLDVLLLCLGAVLNLAECSAEIREILALHCEGLLESTINVFLHARQKTSEADSLAASQANVAYGWLAVLLGNLCQNSNIRRRLRQALPGRGLEALLEAVDEFVIHHKEADKTAQSNEAYVTFTNRLQSVADMLRAFEETND